MTPADAQALALPLLRDALPSLLAVYAFGSQTAGQARPDSDWDLAVLVAGQVPPTELWALGHRLAEALGTDVDLLDFRAASTVMQSQILHTGQRWWAKDASVPAYEAHVLNEKLRLDEARAPLLADIQARGRVHGR